MPGTSTSAGLSNLDNSYVGAGNGIRVSQVPQSTKDKTSVKKFNFTVGNKVVAVDNLQQKSSRPNKHSNLL